MRALDQFELLMDSVVDVAERKLRPAIALEVSIFTTLPLVTPYSRLTFQNSGLTYRHVFPFFTRLIAG